MGTKRIQVLESLLRESLEILETTQPEAWWTFSTKASLGAAVLGERKFADAEPLLLAGYEGMKINEQQIPPRFKACLSKAVDRLIELYTATDKPGEIAKWRTERKKYPQPMASAAPK